ncbi:MAG: hypothetical protein GY858_00370 [Candidatus Omnitrophica bacterium]|nr:hypothetical protein [Candidatus Omnitrophota bacterium]
MLNQKDTNFISSLKKKQKIFLFLGVINLAIMFGWPFLTYNMLRGMDATISNLTHQHAQFAKGYVPERSEDSDMQKILLLTLSQSEKYRRALNGVAMSKGITPALILALVSFLLYKEYKTTESVIAKLQSQN